MNHSKDSEEAIPTDISQQQGTVGRGEIAAVFIVSGLAVVAEWILSYWQLTPPALDIWSAIVWRGGSLFWICGLVATNLVAYTLARNGKEVWSVVLLGLAIFAMSYLLLPAHGTQYDRIFAAATWLGVFGLCALAFQARRPAGLEILLTAVCFSFFVPISTAYLAMTSTLNPETMDLHAYAFDLSLQSDIAPYVFALFRRSALVSTISLAAYVSLLAAYLVLSALQARFVDRSVTPALRIFLIAAIVGFTCYFVFPVVGPRNFFGVNYPLRLPNFSQFAVQWQAAHPTARNGMPSLHFAWALLLVLNVPRCLPYARAAFALFCFLTMLGTLGSGEHYFVDLIAALPFTSLIQAMGLSVGHGHRRLMASILRSGFVFVGFLTLIAVSPQWLHNPLASWSVTILLTVHFLGEIALQNEALKERRSAEVPSLGEVA